MSKVGVMLREHEIQKFIWRYYTSENGDCRLNTRLDVCKLQKFSNRSGACIVAKTVIFRLAAVTGVGFQKQSERQPGGMRRPGGGVRGGKPPQGTGGQTYPFIDAMYPLDTADLNAPRIPPGRVVYKNLVARGVCVVGWGSVSLNI